MSKKLEDLVTAIRIETLVDLKRQVTTRRNAAIEMMKFTPGSQTQEAFTAGLESSVRLISERIDNYRKGSLQYE